MRVFHEFRFIFVAGLLLICAMNTMADLTGTYNASSSSTGTVPITGAPAAGPFTVGGAGPSFCINGDGCSTAGLFGAVSVTATQVSFTFFGSTTAESGSFTINLTNFTGAPITGVSLVSGSLIDGSFAVSGFTANSISFTGATTTDFNGVGGRTITFAVATATAPPPSVPALSTWALAMTAIVLGGLGALRLWRPAHNPTR
jgi:hypothetical protein